MRRRGFRLVSIRGAISSIMAFTALLGLLPFLWVILGPYILSVAVGLVIGVAVGKAYRRYFR